MNRTLDRQARNLMRTLAIVAAILASAVSIKASLQKLT